MHLLIQQGLDWLNRLSQLPEKLAENHRKLESLVKSLSNHHEIFSWLSVIQALKAAQQNTFGVGAVVVDYDHKISVAGHNQVSTPYFRSGLHAEMVVLNQFEESCRSKNPPMDYQLFTSLEPCMMCLGSQVVHI